MATFRRSDRKPVLWRVLPGLTPYAKAIGDMHQAHAALIRGEGREEIRLLTSPAGFNPGGLSRLEGEGAGVPRVAGVPIEIPPGKPRAGDWTYTGPGVRGIIVLLDLRARRKDGPGLVAALHDWIIAALAELGVAGGRREAFDPAGVWVDGHKIAAIGLRMTRFVTSYGIGLFVDPDLAHLAGVKMCGIAGKDATSIAGLARALPRPPAATGRVAAPDMAEVDAALRRAFEPIFGATSSL